MILSVLATGTVGIRRIAAIVRSANRFVVLAGAPEFLL